MGPISLKPHGGKGWFRKGLPGRIPATYKKQNGTRYEYACLNVFHQTLSVRQEEHKGGADLATVREVPAFEVPCGPEGLHHPGRAQRPLDPRGEGVGEDPQGDPRLRRPPMQVG